METVIHPFHMGTFLSPFPYGDHHMETGNRFIQLPIWKQGSPYGNGDFQGMCKSPFPYGDHHMETGNRFIQLPIWKRGSPYGNDDFQGMCKSLFPYGDHYQRFESNPRERENYDFLSKIWGKILFNARLGGRQKYAPHFHMGSPSTEMGRES
jgi:hypothetical protein